MDVLIKKRMRPRVAAALIIFMGVLWSFFPAIAHAEDNSSTVPGNAAYTEDAFYYSDQYMWKASLFVAKSDTVNKDSSNMNDFYRIGDQAVYLTPVSNWNNWVGGSRPSKISGLFFSKENKVDTIMELQSKGGDVNTLDPVQFSSAGGVYTMLDSDVPYVPQLSDGDTYDNGVIDPNAVGNISKVATYFNNPYKIFGFLNFYANKQGTTVNELVKNLEFTIDGETRTGWNPEGILPNVINDNPTNQVEWLVVYEPVSIVYVKDTAHAGSYYGYALSATDFAVSQIKHQMDWRYDETRWTAWAGQQPDAWKANQDRQHVSRLAFLLMGNSVITKNTWYGLEAGTGVDQNAAIPYNRWFSDQQAKYGGWGMSRWIKPASYEKPRNNDYRPNTDVVLSTPVYSNINATPGSELTVTYKINGEVIGTDSLVAPMKTESYSYLKWHTPSVDTVTSYDLEMSISPYPEGTINCGGNEYTHRTVTIRPLAESTPPDPKVDDKMPSDLPKDLVPPSTVSSEDTVDETAAPIVKSVTAVTSAPYYKNETVKIEVVTNRATKNLNFTNVDSGAGKQFGSDSLGDGMLISRNENVLANEIVWTIEFVPANLGTNHYQFLSINSEAGQSSPYTYDVEVIEDPDIPVINDVLISPIQALYTLYEEVVKTPLTYDVYFNSNGGNEIETQSILYNTTLSEPVLPTKEGNTFLGWYKDQDFVYPWNFSTDRITGITTLYAKWSTNTYTVKFDPQGGTDTYNPVQAEYGSNIEIPSEPTRANFRFMGWYHDIGCTIPWNFTSDTVLGDTTLYGKWDANTFTVNFDSQGGSLVASQQADYDALITQTDPPVKDGFSFAGWYQDAGCNTVWSFTSDRVKGDLTLYARWNVNVFTITFDSLGGSAVPSQNAQYNTVTTIPIDPPVRSGYSFGGWFKEDFCENTWDFWVDKVTQDTTLYAKWTADEAAIEFVSNNGTTVPKMVGATDREILDTTMPISVRDGYTMNGWFNSADFSGEAITSLPNKYPIGTTIYYAKWTANKSTLHFETNNGTNIADLVGVTDQIIMDTTMPTISKAGYTFNGWFDNAAFEGDVITALPGKYPIDGITYFAKWTANPSVFKFVTNDSDTIADMVGVTDQLVSDTIMPSLTRDGYTFGGWFDNSGFTGAAITALPDKYPVDGTTYFAKWTANPSVIAFEENGGSTVADLTGVTDQVVADTTLPSTMTRAGYSFAGWFATPACDGSALTQLPATFPANGVIYYAKWTALPATILFEENGGSLAANLTGVTDQAISPTTLPVITKDHYTLDGWYDTADFSTTKLSALPSQYPAGGATYYAKWTPVQYTVTYDAMGGSAVTAMQIAYDTYANSPDTPVRDGYVFKGWFKESSCTTQWNFSSDKITGDVTLYAKWEEGIPGPEVPLNDWSWSQINQVAELGLGESYFDVGEEKNITLSTGEMLTLQIYGFNHDFQSGGINKSNITFGLKYLMRDSHAINPNGSGVNVWSGSDMRAYLNGISTTNQDKNYSGVSVRETLPNDLMSVLNWTVKKSRNGASLMNTSDLLFLFSAYEITGDASSDTEEGTPYYMGSVKSRKGQEPCSWWSRSYAYDPGCFWSVGPLGDRQWGGGASSCGVNFGFCIGNAPTNTYSVTYNSNGGSAVASTTATLNTALTAPAEPTKANYSLLGWYKDAGLTQKWDFASDKVTGNMTLYAKWGARITYDSQGGTAVSSVVVPCNATFDAPSSPSKDGYVFKGWYKESACLSPWTFVTDTPAGNTTLYAKWQVGLPDSSVPLNNWSWDQINQVAELGQAQSYFDIGETKDITLFTGEVLTLQIYDFNHDNLADGSGKSNITFGTKNMLMSPHVMNSIDSNYGGWNWSEMRNWINSTVYNEFPNDLIIKVKETNKSTIEPKETRTLTITKDKLFLFSEKEVYGTCGNSAPGEGNLYPIFSSNESRIKIDPAIGIPRTYFLRSPYFGNDNFFTGVYENGTFYDAWKYMADEENGVVFGFCIGNALTNQYTVSYNTNGGSAIANTTATLNTTIAAPTAPTKANAIFDNWYKDAALTVPFNFSTDKITSDTTLYAKWKTLPALGTALADCTWDQIAMVANAGLGDDYWNVGDCKDMALSTGEVVTMQIYDFNHDDKSDGTGKTNITFGTKNAVSTVRPANPSETNAYGWNGSYIRALLNGVSTSNAPSDFTSGNSVYSTIPNNIKNNIKRVAKKTSAGQSNKDTLITSDDYLFLFSEKEIYGVNNDSLAGEGYQYPIFTNNSSRIKLNNSGTPEAWWGRSPQYSSGNQFTAVDAGGALVYSPSYSLHMVAFGFCMGTAPQYTVSYDTQGGSAAPASQTVEVNKTITKPTTDPTKSGAGFGGWYKDVACTTAWDFANDKVTGSTTLYAKWITLPAVGVSLESCSWEQIAAISKAGLGDTYFNVGDEKTASLGTYGTVTFQIYGFDHDDKADGSGKANITFGMKGALNTKHYMNQSNTNCYGWVGSDLRGWLNGVHTSNQSQDYTTGTTSMWSQLPAALKAQITPVKKYTSSGYDDQTLKTSTDNLFLFSETETFDTNIYTRYVEGTQYPIFTTDDYSRVKYKQDGSLVWWWLRSPCFNSNSDFMSVDGGGTYGGGSAPSIYGVAFGFSI